MDSGSPELFVSSGGSASNKNMESLKELIKLV
jgi:hypothetical protein